MQLFDPDERPDWPPVVFNAVLRILEDRVNAGAQELEDIADEILADVFHHLNIPGLVSAAYQDGMDFMRELVSTMTGQAVPDPQEKLL